MAANRSAATTTIPPAAAALRVTPSAWRTPYAAVPAMAALAYRFPRRSTSGISALRMSRMAPPAEPVTVPSNTALGGGSPACSAICAPATLKSARPSASATSSARSGGGRSRAAITVISAAATMTRR